MPSVHLRETYIIFSNIYNSNWSPRAASKYILYYLSYLEQTLKPLINTFTTLLPVKEPTIHILCVSLSWQLMSKENNYQRYYFLHLLAFHLYKFIAHKYLFSNTMACVKTITSRITKMNGNFGIMIELEGNDTGKIMDSYWTTYDYHSIWKSKRSLLKMYVVMIDRFLDDYGHKRIQIK